MSDSAVKQRPFRSRSGMQDKSCPLGCGAAFFTTVGVEEHTRVGCGNDHNAPLTVRRDWKRSKHGKAVLRARGLAVTALINSRRVQCGQCDKVSTPAGLALHQRSANHSGRIELA